MAILLASSVTGCGLFRRGPEPLAPVPGATQTGVASWYGPGFHGRRTASGEIYDQYGLTAAHRTLPHGTWVQVTNLDNGRDVQVRVNDRGPYVDDRVIDLSYSAAQRVDMIGSGIAPVRVEVIGEEGPAPIAVAAPAPRPVPPPASDAPGRAAAAPPVAADGGARYRVHAGVYVDYQRARREQRRLDGAVGRVHLALIDAPDSRFYELRVGPFGTRAEAARAALRLVELGAPALVVSAGAAR